MNADYKEYLASSHWKETRKAALERAWYRCQLCNSETDLHVHHNTYDRIGYEAPRDLVVLCKTCHSKFHDKVENSGREADNKWYTKEELETLIGH